MSEEPKPAGHSLPGACRWIPYWEIDEHILRWLAAKRDFGSLVDGNEPAIIHTEYARLRIPELRREFERSLPC